MTEPLKLWFWTVTDEITKKRRQTRYRMTEEQARERFGDDAVKVEGSLEIREGAGQSTGDFLRPSNRSRRNQTMGQDDDFYASATAGSTGYTTTMPIVVTASTKPLILSPGLKTVEVPPEVKMFRIRTDLPDGHLLGISRIMVQWSLQEWLLQQILFDLTTGDPKLGRLSVGFPRSEDAVNRIEQLAGARGIVLEVDTRKLKREVKRLEKYRDQVGHGIWMLDDAGRWCVVVYSGNWEAGEWQGTSKRITPHAKPIDEADLAKHVGEIQQSIGLTRALATEVNAKLPK